MKKNVAKKSSLKFIDLFAGLGGTRIGFESACKSLNLRSECVFTSEIKDSAVRTYKKNFKDNDISGDITKVEPKDIPNFDYLLGGFPCQPFSSAGKRRGFYDTRGTLFFDIEKIIEAKKPKGFLLENVEGLINHDKGKTLEVIITNLKSLGYNVDYALINSLDCGVPQQRKRTYIIGRKRKKVDLKKINANVKKTYLRDILEKNISTLNSKMTKKLLKKYPKKQLYGKSIKDKRGGEDNIHSWNIELKGSVTEKQNAVLDRLLKERRRKQWAEIKKIKWMDGMPLTLDEIYSFSSDIYPDKKKLKKSLDDLLSKDYLKFEHPKEQVLKKTEAGNVLERVQDPTKPKGYNIVTGKLSFEITKILDPNGVAPTLVATDATRLAVVDTDGLRRLTIREGLRLFGFPEWYEIEQSHTKAFDLLGNSIVVPAVKKVSMELLK